MSKRGRENQNNAVYVESLNSWAANNNKDNLFIKISGQVWRVRNNHVFSQGKIFIWKKKNQKSSDILSQHLKSWNCVFKQYLSLGSVITYLTSTLCCICSFHSRKKFWPWPKKNGYKKIPNLPINACCFLFLISPHIIWCMLCIYLETDKIAGSACHGVGHNYFCVVLEQDHSRFLTIPS